MNKGYIITIPEGKGPKDQKQGCLEERHVIEHKEMGMKCENLCYCILIPTRKHLLWRNALNNQEDKTIQLVFA